ncbi:MAG: hypothetical protein J6Y29_01465 [Clostridiales bacterium]|nr:hypothetical protein [Clostridiales bacterium]
MTRKKFIWHTPEDKIEHWCGIVYMSDKKHVIFREMHQGQDIPKDCVCWATINELMKYGLENSDMKYLLEDKQTPQ